MDLKCRLLAIRTTLEDLQSGVDASERETFHIELAAESLDRLHLRRPESANLVRTMVRHTTELQLCVCDQQAALPELRCAVAGLDDQLNASDAKAKRLRATAADRQRR